MSRVATYLRVGSAVSTALLLMMYPVAALAAPAPVITVTDDPDVIITEVQTAADKASKEFVELYNLTDEDIIFADSLSQGTTWKLQFYSSTSISLGEPDWTRPNSSLVLSGTIPANGYAVVASEQYLPPPLTSVHQQYSDRMASTGGGLQIVRTDGSTITTHDRIMWSSAADAPESVELAAPAGGSLQRYHDDVEGYYETTDDGIALYGFVDELHASPGNAWTEQVAIPPAESPDSSDEPGRSVPKVMPADNTDLLSIMITELLPNPGPPLADENDEFIELYNPNTVLFDLTGYSLESGVSTKHIWNFPEGTIILPGDYLALFSSDTGLALSNSTSQVRLISPDGNALQETAAYESAKDNTAWAWTGTNWTWTITATPGHRNVLAVHTSEKPAAIAAALTAKKQAAKTAAAKSAAKTKAKISVKKAGAKTRAKATKTKIKKEAKPAQATVAKISEPEQKTMIHSGVLVGVAGLAVLYGAYEYRHDVANRIRQYRHNRAVRLGHR